MGFGAVDFPGVFTVRGVSRIDLGADVTGAFTGGTDQRERFKPKCIDFNNYNERQKVGHYLNVATQIKPLPRALLGENVVPVSLFLFFSLSRRDVNSSSELSDSFSLEGAERVRFGEAGGVVVLWGRKEQGEQTERNGSDGKPSRSSHCGALSLVNFAGVLALKWRVLQVLLTTTLSSSSSLSLTKTGELH